ncbi:UNVERIFIED_CONTAM: protein DETOXIFICATION 48 [Sesamum calycinum]|uniref:Protein DETOXIFICATION n=2 Tax=Sesamum TaxID=4181 RepID=A0AAW2QMB3_9LAMI
MDLLIDDQELHRWPNPSEALEEIKEIGKISGPTAITGLILYSRAMISMLFLGYLGELELAGGSLSIGVANITGYSVISGLAMGMEPICGQAYGAKQMKLLGLALQRTILLLLTTSIPISFMWLNMKRILLWWHHITIDVLLIYLSSASCPVELSPGEVFQHGIAGVALAMALTNLNLVLLLCSYIYFSGVYKGSWVAPSLDCLKGWSSLLSLAIPTCISVCLEWWCLGVSTRVSNELGARRPAKARISMIVSLFCAVALGVAAMLFTTLMRHRWGRFFTGDAEILELTTVALPIAGLCELGNCPQTTGCGVLRGSARPTIGANINLGSFYLVGMPVAFFMGFGLKLGFAGLWLGLLAAQGCCALLMLFVLCRTDWILQVERAKELTKAQSSSSSSNSSSSSGSLLPVSTAESKEVTKKRADTTHNNLDQIILCPNDEFVLKSSPPLETDPLIITTQVHHQ